MAFGKQNTKLKTKVFKYRAYEPDQPKLVNDNLFLCNRLRNKLIEIGRKYRDLKDECLRKHDPGLPQMERELEDLQNEITSLEEKLKKDNQTEGKRNRKSELPALKKKRTALKKQINTRKKELRATQYSEEVEKKQAEYDELRKNCGPNSKKLQAAKQELISLKKQNSSGYVLELFELQEHERNEIDTATKESELFWSHINQIKDSASRAMSTSNPRFRRFDGTGGLSTQIQMRNNKSAIPDVYMPNQWFYITGEGRKRHASLRIGSEARKPVMIHFDFMYHREIEGEIKSVAIHKRKVATKTIWELHITCSAASFASDIAHNDKSVAVDVGWRDTEYGLKVAHAKASDDYEEILYLPPWLCERWKRIETISSARDTKFNEIKDKLVQWIKTADDLPDWFKERTSHIHQWKSQRRLASLILFWRDNRFPGDETIFELLDGTKDGAMARKGVNRGSSKQLTDEQKDHLDMWNGWRNWDKHLYEYSENLRKKAIDCRLDLYRKFAARLARKYGRVIVEKNDWSHTMRKASVDKASNDHIKKGQRIASPGLLVDILCKKIHSFEKIDPRNTSKECHMCGYVNSTLQGESTWTCIACNATWDRDYNSCVNLLARAGVETKTLEPLERRVATTYDDWGDTIEAPLENGVVSCAGSTT